MSAGYGPDVQDAVVRCALQFHTSIVVKRKFKLSGKSAIVSSVVKLAHRVAKELSQYGMSVQVSRSVRDVGVMFTAGVFSDSSNSKVRMIKATKRTSRIARVSQVSRSARKLFTSGSYPGCSLLLSVV